MSFCSATHTSTLQHTNTHTQHTLTRAHTCRDIIYLTAASVVPVFTNMPPPPPAQLPLSLYQHHPPPLPPPCSPAQSHFPFRFSRRCGFFVCLLLLLFTVAVLVVVFVVVASVLLCCVVLFFSFALAVHWYSFCMPFVPRPCPNDAPICWQFPSICICGTSACALLKPFAALLYCFCTWNAYGLQLIEHSSSSSRQENN